MNTDNNDDWVSPDERRPLAEEAFEFEPGELDRLIAEGEASESLDGEAVLADFRKLRGQSSGR